MFIISNTGDLLKLFFLIIEKRFSKHGYHNKNYKKKNVVIIVVN